MNTTISSYSNPLQEPLKLSKTLKFLRTGFRLTASFGLLVGASTLLWQIGWNVITSSSAVNWSFELEICFGLYGLFLASTSYYLTQILARSWAWFHFVASAIGILLDIILLSYHAHLLINGGQNKGNLKNHHFMISIALFQMAINYAAARLSLKILAIPEDLSLRQLYAGQIDDEEDVDKSLLRNEQ